MFPAHDLKTRSAAHPRISGPALLSSLAFEVAADQALTQHRQMEAPAGPPQTLCTQPPPVWPTHYGVLVNIYILEYLPTDLRKKDVIFKSSFLESKEMQKVFTTVIGPIPLTLLLLIIANH